MSAAKEERTTDSGSVARDDWASAYAYRAGWGVLLMALVAGFAEGATKSDGVRLLTALGVPWSIAYFCALDARVHQKVFVNVFWLLTFLTWPIAPLFYLIHTRGKRGALTYALYAALELFCIGTSLAVGSLIKR